MRREDILNSYASYTPTHSHADGFRMVLVLSIAVAIVLGLFFKTVKPVIIEITEQVQRVQASFVMPEEKKAEPKKIIPKPEKVVSQEPVDLTNQPLMNQKTDIPQTVPDNAPKVKPVYGLRKVYSYGIGAGGSSRDAIIGKVGNTIAKEFDTVTATKTEIKGTVASATTVSSAPKFSKRVTPSYSQEMLDNKIEGVIKVRILVDIDGKVKKAILLNDLGHGAGAAAIEACLAMEFAPAMRGTDAVAVWIIIPITFTLIGG